MTETCKILALTSFAINFSTKKVLNLFFINKKSAIKPYFGRQWNLFTFCILAERGRPGHSNQENRHGSNRLIGNFPTLHNSKRDNEMCWLLDVRSLTNLPDSVISSHKTKGSVIPQETRTGQVELVVWRFGQCFTGQNMTGQGGMRTEWGEDRLLSRIKSLWYFGRSYMSN